MLSAGATITRHGLVSARRRPPAPDLTQFRITAPSTDQSDFGPQPNARVDKDGRFTLSGVSAGRASDPADGNGSRDVDR